MPNIFFSYRRDDSKAATHRIFDRFKREFGKSNCFIDADIGAGDWLKAVMDALTRSQVCVVVIGQGWLHIRDPKTGDYRLFQNEDVVALEIRVGLLRPLLVTILLDGTPMPSASQLPIALARLPDRQAFQVRTDHTHFDSDVHKVVRAIRRVYPRWWLRIAAAMIIAALIVFGGLAIANFVTIANPTPTPPGIVDRITDTPTGTAPPVTNTPAVIAPSVTDTPVSAAQQLETAQALLVQNITATAISRETATAQAISDATRDEGVRRFYATETAAQSTLLALSFTPTRTPSFTPTLTYTPTLTFTPDPLIVADTFSGSNDDWTPYSQVFNGVTMMLVPAGSFEMGSTQAEIDAGFAMCQAAADNGAACDRGWFNDELIPAEGNVQSINAFWIDRTEVSRAQYQVCVDADACTTTPASDYSTRPDQPINRVTWEQATAYCAWRGARLPTETEWEFAARGPDRRTFPWGGQFDGARANHCDGNCGEASWASGYNFVNQENDDGHAVTAPVASYAQGASDGSSWVGALNLSGNVWEWTSSLYQGYPYDRVDGREDQENRTDVRVVRGGSFLNTTNDLRAANRSYGGPPDGNLSIGFRCALSSRTP